MTVFKMSAEWAGKEIILAESPYSYCNKWKSSQAVLMTTVFDLFHPQLYKLVWDLR